MDAIVLDSVSKVFRHRPALFNWLGRERSGETRALDGVCLRVPTSKILVLLGPNGSGKTTILKLISTLLLPDQGRVLVGGADTFRHSDQIRHQVGLGIAGARSFFPRLSARENLDFFAALDDVPRAERARRVEAVLASVGLSEESDTLVMKFSTGMYQRLGMARALIKRPSIMLLDEPTRSLDPASSAHCWELIRELPRYESTVVVATHNFEEAIRIADSVAILAHGVLAGQHKVIEAIDVDQLRSYYFRATGETDAVESTRARGRP